MKYTYIIKELSYYVNGKTKYFLFIKDFIDDIKFIGHNIHGGIHMTVSQKIKMALAYKGMSQAELARRMGVSPQTFNSRMKTDKFSSEELIKMAAILGAEYVFGFEFEDGTRI